MNANDKTKQNTLVENRNTTIDDIKGLLIIFVVLGHTYNPLFRDFIYLFHVGMFFVLSGYCFNQKYTEDLGGLKDLLVKRIKSLWVPYVAYNFVFLLLQNVFVRVGFLTTDEAYFAYSPMLPDGFCQPLTLRTGVIAFIKSLFFMNSRPFAGGLWFLGGLFYVTAGYAAIQFVMRKFHLEKFHITISVLMLVAGWLLVKTDIYLRIPVGKQVCIILIAEVLFTLGTYIRTYIVFPELRKWQYAVGFVYFSALTYFLSLHGTVSIANVHIENPLFYITSVLTGGGMVFCFVKLVPVFSYIGRRTVPILALHPICFKIVSVIQWKMYGGEDVVLALYPVWTRSPFLLWSLVCGILGVAVPLLIAAFLAKSKVGKVIFKC